LLRWQGKAWLVQVVAFKVVRSIEDARVVVDGV
jgi:hypothetical protein